MTLQFHNTQRPTNSTEDISLFWKPNLGLSDAKQWVRRKLPKATSVEYSFYHHPMAGVELLWSSPKAQPTIINVIVDAAVGRGYVSAPWSEEDFEPLLEERFTENAVEMQMAEPALSEDQIVDKAKAIGQILITRKRRLGNSGALSLRKKPLYFGKPNWWVTGRNKGNKLELILDAVNGKHYVFSG